MTHNDRDDIAKNTPQSGGSVQIAVGAMAHLGPGLPLELKDDLRRHFTTVNPAYTDAASFRRSTRGIPRDIKHFSQDHDGILIVPRGAMQDAKRMCAEYGVEPSWQDQTYRAPDVEFQVSEAVHLLPAQEQAVTAALARRTGVIVAPTGGGKTLMALIVIARRKQPALLIVHNRRLAYQAIVEAQRVLGLDEAEIGLVGDGHCRIGQKLTVALVQSLARGIPPELLKVGHVVADECHHVAADQWSGVVSQFPARFILGLTATPYRGDKLDRVIHFYLGPITAEIDRKELTGRLVSPLIVPRMTQERPTEFIHAKLMENLCTSRRRNELIVSDVARAVQVGRRCLVLSDRVEHVEALVALLWERKIAAATLHGEMRTKDQDQVIEQVDGGSLSVVVATGSFIGEGFNSPCLDALFLATPFSDHGRVVQYVGRVSRRVPGKEEARVFDYIDDHPMLSRAWRKREKAYLSLGLSVWHAPIKAA